MAANRPAIYWDRLPSVPGDGRIVGPEAVVFEPPRLLSHQLRPTPVHGLADDEHHDAPVAGREDVGRRVELPAVAGGDPIRGEDRLFDEGRARGGERGEIFSARMAEWCAERTTEQALAELEAARVPAGPVYTPRQALDDPHVRQGGFTEETEYPGAPGPVPLVTTPVRLLGTPGAIRSRAPQLGEHTAEILEELGYASEDVERLRTAGAV